MNGFFREYVWKRFARSRHWPGVRKAFLTQHKYCAACGTDKNRHVHHIHPFGKFPSLELSETNLIVLCSRCHFTIGHSNNWKHWNLAVKEVCLLLRLKQRAV